MVPVVRLSGVIGAVTPLRPGMTLAEYQTINRDRIQVLVEKFADFRERFVEFILLRGGNARIRHCPIRHEASEKQTLGESQCLGSGKKEFLRLLDFFLPLDF